MNGLVPLAILSLLLPLRLRAEFVFLRPFEVLTLCALLAVAVRMRRDELARLPVRPGVLLLLPFFGWHVAAAAPGGPANVVREALQMTLLLLFAWALSLGAPRLDARRAGRVLLHGMALVVAAVVAWHLAHGIPTGWKTFAEPRLGFVFLPVVLSVALLFAGPGRRRLLWLAWAALLPVILLSGERKALLIHVFLTVVLLLRKRNLLVLPLAVAVMAAGIALVALLLDNPYIDRQLQTLTQPQATGKYEEVLATGRFAEGDTPSNAQRAFALRMALDLFAGSPLAGIGTNQYVAWIAQRFWYLPEHMLVSIHGEFLRILAENGAIGLLLYSLVWLAAWRRLRRALQAALGEGRVTARQAALLPYCVFVPTLLFVATEASGSRAFVVLILVSLLPDLQRFALAAPASAPLAARARATAP